METNKLPVEKGENPRWACRVCREGKQLVRFELAVTNEIDLEIFYLNVYAGGEGVEMGKSSAEMGPIQKLTIDGDDSHDAVDAKDPDFLGVAWASRVHFVCGVMTLKKDMLECW
eukprot:GABV01010376.1.p2 GENE.GABV01010376.1~~GABV01010376.1.p2  ORF type:complete len:114 (+),score=39.25 GABV01010376.1:39-380(+)